MKNIRFWLAMLCVIMLFDLLWVNMQVIEINRVINDAQCPNEEDFLKQFAIAMRRAAAIPDSLLIDHNKPKIDWDGVQNGRPTVSNHRGH